MVDQHERREQRPASDNSPVGTGTYRQIRGTHAPARSTTSLSPRSVLDIPGGGAFSPTKERAWRAARRWRRRSGTSGPARPKSGRSGFRRSRTAMCACARVYSAISRGTEALIAAGRVPESEYQRMRAPFMGGQLPVPGEIRLRHGRRGRGRAGGARRPQRLCAASPPDQVRSCRPRPWCRCPATFRCRARCWPPTWRPRSTRPGMRRPARPGASRWSAPAWSARWSGFCARASKARTVTLIDIDPARADLGAGART